MRYSSYTVEIYLAYVRRLREIADLVGKELSEVDEQLYCFDDQFNGTIDS
jgi:hypothetical protein